MEVSVAELRVVADKLFAHLLQLGHDTVSITHDYYWAVPKDTRHDPYVQPVELTLGQLSDEISELKRISDGTAEPISFGLVWLSSIIREIGEETVE